MDKSLSSRRYYFNSSNRLSSSASPADMAIVLANQIDPRYNAMVVRKVNIPYTYYTINDSNNKMYWTDSLSDTLIISTLTNGRYTPSTLATMIQTVMNADTLNTQTYVITSSSTTYKFTFTSTGNFKLYGLTYSALSYKACWKIIGLTADYQGSAAYNMLNIYNMQPSNGLYVESNLASSTAYTQVGSKGIILSIPINVNFGDILHYEPQTFNPIPLNNTASYVTFRLLDDNFNVISLGGLEWDIEIDFLQY